MKTIAAVILICLAVGGCVDGNTGKFFICGVTTTCK